MAKKDMESDIRSASNEVSARASDMKHQVMDNLNTAKEQLGQSREQIEQYITSNPMKSVLIAAGVGAVLGSLWASAMSRR